MRLPGDCVARPKRLLPTSNHEAEPVTFLWLCALGSVPIVLSSMLVGDLGFVTGRRLALFVSLPVVVMAGLAFAWMLDRAPVLVVPVVVVLLLGLNGEVDQMLDQTDRQWDDETFAFVPYPQVSWQPMVVALRNEVKQGPVRLFVGDTDGFYTWANTGAQPLTQWLPGYAKIGYDLTTFTGSSYVERAVAAAAAADRGRAGVCAMGESESVDRYLLQRRGDLIGTRDIRPSQVFRLEPGERLAKNLRRDVAEGMQYLDLSAAEGLVVRANIPLTLSWADPSLRIVEVLFLDRDTRNDPTWTLETGGATIAPSDVIRHRDAFTVRFELPDGAPSDIVLRASSDVLYLRTVGFEPLPLPELVTDELALFGHAELCPS